MIRWQGITTKLVLSFTLIAAASVALTAFLVNRATASEFGTYLGHAQEMNWMMGGGSMMPIAPGSPESDFLSRVQGAYWLAGGLGVALALALAYLAAHQLSQPLRQLSVAAQRVAAGHLEERVPAASQDEVGDLAQAFNAMAGSLERQQRARRQLMVDIAHELRTPLTVLQGGLEAMMDEVVPMEKASLATYHQEVLLMSRLVSDLRDLSLAEAGQLKLELQPVDLKAVLGPQMEAVYPQAQGKGLELSLDISADLPPVMADPSRLAQVMSNLLSNALRHTSQGGIRVEARLTEGQEVVVSMADTGTGIKAEDLPHIFDRFYRASRGGTGVGLAIVREMVAAHGGRVWAESQSGKGSSFYFTLKAAQQRGPRQLCLVDGKER
ncbi:MAG: HAMP domain-containing histidine kinase [Chloroflexi bacterium]|nr:HAMP domain-containing histidine kinase [Chloroflexota bacterium]